MKLITQGTFLGYQIMYFLDNPPNGGIYGDSLQILHVISLVVVRPGVSRWYILPYLHFRQSQYIIKA